MLPLTETQIKSFPLLQEFNPAALPPGNKGIFDFQIAEAPDKTVWGIRVLFVRGTQAGPVLLVNGGTHGDEYEGPATVQELFHELSPADIQGTWLGVPVLNEPAMSISQRFGPFDHRDLARNEVGHGLARALVGHVNDIDARTALQHLARKMPTRGRAR